ncbi:hypothetical protein [Nocardioides terrigena]|uniref:hypothetical protein n=1 Tax=Nocardioides terrigena TaxID=424797 RepID=UPI00131F2AC9|nr:hypothetical protein [Nocardioides terrigena]
MDGISLYGPDRLEVGGSTTATVESAARRSFHGVAPLGLLPHPALTPQAWERLAPRLDEAVSDLDGLVSAARSVGVLTFEESLRAARHVAEEYGAGRGPTELWGAKEGHVASVWRASFGHDHEAAPAVVALNVSRDSVAAEELKSVARRLRQLSQRCPDLVAEVLGVWHLEGDRARGHSVVVVAQRWLDDSLEINPLRLSEGGTRLCRVARFLTDPARPAHIEGVVGSALDELEHRRLGADLGRLIAASAERSEDGTGWTVPSFVLERGDLVWHAGGGVAVACAGSSVTVPAATVEEAAVQAVGAACHSLDERHVWAVLEGAASAQVSQS